MNEALIISPISAIEKIYEKAVFLSEWCKPYGLNNYDEIKSIETIEYHWDDIVKLESDYKYLIKLHEHIMKGLVEYMNSYHGVKNTNKYWSIILGPWLSYILHSTYDKWETVRRATEGKRFKNIYSGVSRVKDYRTQSMNHFFSNNISSVSWNTNIILDILEFKNISKIEYISEGKGNSKKENHSQNNGLLRSLLRAYIKITSRMAKKDSFFFISTYLNKKNDFILQLKLGQIPKFWQSDPEIPNIEKCERPKFIFFRKNKSEYEEFIENELIKHIPLSYLEGFKKIKEIPRHSGWPETPKVIFSSNALWHDDIAKIYLAEKIEKGAKLIYGQHGGFGLIKFSWAEYWEKKISDKYLTWGWVEKGNDSIYPIGIIKENIKPTKYKDKKKLLLVRSNSSQYAFRIDSSVGVTKQINSIKRCIQLAKRLRDNIRDDALIVRLYNYKERFKAGGVDGIENDFYNEGSQWRDNFPAIYLCNGKENIQERLNESRLVIYSYNAGTGYLEYLSIGIPTILFVDTHESPFNSEAKEAITLLKKCGVFHENPESAADFINKIWCDVESWWNSEAVASAVENFVKKYAYRNINLINDLAYIMRCK